MRIISYHAIFAIITFLVFISSLVSAAESKTNLAEIEKIAASYMTAFFQGDISIAANLTHPDTLNELQRSFLAELDRAKQADQERAFLSQMAVNESGQKLREMTALELYITLVGSDHKRDPKAFEEMKKTKVEVINSKMQNANEAIVYLKIMTPTQSGTKTQNSGLLLSRSGTEWKVKGNAK